MPKYTTTPGAMRLLLEGSLALSEIEHHGVRVDKAYLETAILDADRKIKEADTDLRSDPAFRLWRRRYGDKTNPASPEQLAGVVFGEMGYKPRRFTEKTEREAATELAFEHVNEPFVRKYFKAQKLRKGRDTYLVGIQREMVQHDDRMWYVHPRYWLNRVITFRSSSSDPNWTNQPARNPEMAETVRKCFIPRPGQHITEIDYGQIEVRIPCAYNFDPVLMQYVCDPSRDMHRDMAAQIFVLTEKQGKQKNIRHLAKNQYVFPTFYGSFYAQCAPNIWGALEVGNIKIDGTDMTVIEHLKSKGITELGECDGETEPRPGTFVYHLKKVEEHFWGTRFKVYAQWKRDWYAAYLRDGGFQTLTGYAVNTPLDRKQVCNSPIQCDAFQCTLWSLPRLNAALRKYDFKTRVIGEVHDSVQFDGPASERDDVIGMATKIMTRDITKSFTWLNVPLVVEAEVCPVGLSWYDKVVVVDKGNGAYAPADMEKFEKKYGPWSEQA